MSRTSLANAKAELYSLLIIGNLPAVSGVENVHDHLPPYSSLGGSVDLAVFTAGQTADFWLIGLRLFVHQGADAKAAQDRLDDLLPLIDAATNTGGFGPSAWQLEYPTGDPWVITATSIYDVGRETGPV